MTEKIYVGIDGNQVEATGKLLEEVLQRQSEALIYEEAKLAKEAAKASALAKLSALGLTEAEIASL